MPSDDRSIVPQLEALRRELEQARMRAHAVADAATPDLWARRPARAGWSAAECLVHLNLTSERFVPLIADALVRARAGGLTGTGPPFAERVRYNGYSSFCVVAAHQRRHLWQAQRALASLG